MAGHDARAAILAYGLRSHIAALWEQGCGLEAIAASASMKLCRRSSIATAVFLEIAEDRIRWLTPDTLLQFTFETRRRPNGV